MWYGDERLLTYQDPLKVFVRSLIFFTGGAYFLSLEYCYPKKREEE